MHVVLEYSLKKLLMTFTSDYCIKTGTFTINVLKASDSVYVQCLFGTLDFLIGLENLSDTLEKYLIYLAFETGFPFVE